MAKKKTTKKTVVKKTTIKKAKSKKKLAKKTSKKKSSKKTSASKKPVRSEESGKLKATKKKPAKHRYVVQPVAKTPLPKKGYVRVYEIECAVNDYLMLEIVSKSPEWEMRYPIEIQTPTGPETIEREPFDFGDGEMPRRWKPVPMQIEKRKQPEPDFWCVSMTNVFAMTPKAYGLLKKEIDPLGQVLTVPCNGQKLKVLNLLHSIDCLDIKKCAWHDFDAIVGPHKMLATGAEEKIVFQPKKLDDALLFQFPQNSSEYYCVERTGDPEKEFKARVEVNGLTGLHFRLVWEGKG